MRLDTLKDQASRRKVTTLLISFSLGLLASIAFKIIGSQTHIRPDFSSWHSPLIQQLESTVGIMLLTVLFVSALVLRFHRQNAWQYAFLVGVGIGNLLLKLI